MLAAAWTVTGCADRAGDDNSNQAFGSRPEAAGKLSQFPPGAAAPLSIMAPAAEGASDPFEAAVECAAAIEFTAKLMDGMPQVGQKEKLLAQQALGIFRARANGLARDMPAARAIAAKRQEGSADSTGQLRVAMRCLRETTLAG